MQILPFLSLCAVPLCCQFSVGQIIQESEKEDFCGSVGNPNRDSMAYLKDFVRDIFLNGFLHLRKDMEREIGSLRQTMVAEMADIKRNQVTIEERHRALSEDLGAVHKRLSDIFVKIDDNDRQIVQLRGAQNQTDINKENIRMLDEYVASVAGNQSMHVENQDGIAELFAKLSNVSRIMNDSESKIIRNTEEQMTEYSEKIKNLSDYVHFVTANHSVDLMELRTGLLDHQGGIAELFAKLSDVSRIMNDSESKIIRNTEEQMAEYSERIKNLSEYVHFLTANHSVDLMELRTGLLDHQDESLNTTAALLTLQTEVTQLKGSLRNLTEKDVQSDVFICPSGWTLFSTSCYAFIQATRSWDNASMQCLQYGAKLVEVETKEENDFLRKILLKGSVGGVWLGAIDHVMEGKWVWSTSGRSLTFTDWYPGEPNNSGNEDCLEYNPKYNWNDNKCSSPLKFVCEKTYY